MEDQLATLRAGLAHRYLIGSELGRGGMAVVYRAEEISTGSAVAIKVLRSGLSEVLGPMRFTREIAIVGQLMHPNIVPLVDSGEIGGVLYLVMPLVEGETLRQRLRREIQLPVDEAIRIATAVAQGLAHAHDAGIIHRDIKPDNVLLRNGQVLIMDFGLARIVDAVDHHSLSITGLALGTPAYMSPEQASGFRAVDSRSDLYSLGCLLYEMLSGEPPFTGPTAQAIAARQLSEPPRSLRVIRPQVPEGLEAVMDRALRKVPADRYQSALEFRVAIDRVWGEPSRRKPTRVAALSAGLVAILAGSALLLVRPRSETLHDSRFLILPCRFEETADSATTETLKGFCTRLMLQTFRGWRDLDIVDQSEQPTAQRKPADAARATGAANVVETIVHSTGDSTWIEARLQRFGQTRDRTEASSRLAGKPPLAGRQQRPSGLSLRHSSFQRRRTARGFSPLA